jgi:hypothetical protein
MRKILILFLLVGCDSDRVVHEDTGLGQGETVRTVHLADGTRCVVYDGTFSGGIDCDWRAP